MPIALADAQQQAAPPGTSPASGAPGALSDDGLTNHPLDYNAITNEHTAAMTLAKKAALELYQAGRYKEAEKRFLEALQEARLGFPAGDPHIPSAMNNLAELYRNLGRFKEASALYDEALVLLRETYGDKHWLVASCMVNRALLAEAQGDLAQAAQLLEAALELRRQLFSTGSYIYADTAASLAKVLLAQVAAAKGAAATVGTKGRAARAEAATRDELRARAVALLSKAVEAVEASGNVAGTPILQWQLALAGAQLQQQHAAAAVATLRGAMQHFVESSGEATAQASEVAEKLVEALEASGQVDEAVHVMQQCVEARAQLFGRHLVVAKSMSRLAALLLKPPIQPGGPQQAAHYAANAASIAEGVLQDAVKAPAMFSFQRPDAKRDADKAAERLRAALELAAAARVLVDAQEAAGARGASAGGGSLRRAADALRAAQARGVDALRALGAATWDENPMLDKLAGLILDAKLQQLECVERLTTLLKQQQQAQQPQPHHSKLPPQHPSQQQQSEEAGPSLDGDDAELRMLLVEAEMLAAELYGD